jgi:cobalt-zinc-cadmium resistance protein CzcA
MLKTLIEFAIARRLLILGLAVALVVAGLIALTKLPFDAFPDTTPVMVQVNVSAPGWAPDDIEKQVTYPVERELSGLSGLSEIRSISKYGISQVNLIFEEELDIYRARQQVTERLNAVQLPAGVEPPKLGPISTGLGEIFHYVVVGKTDDPTELRTVQDWIVKPQLQSVPGVAEVNSWGGYTKQYHILYDPNRLVQYGLSLGTVVDVVRESIGNVPGGQIVRAGEQTLVTGIGTVSRREQIENIVIETRNDIPIHVHDIGDVVIGHEIRRGAATYQGQGEVVLGLGFMITGQNSRDIATQLTARLKEIGPTLPPGIQAKPVYVRTQLVDQVLDTVKHNLAYGAALVIAVLFLFLGNLRAGLIVASAIPLSMLFAVDLMTRFGIVGSLMSLGAIDFGLAVDNAVIQVENAVRRLSHPKAEKSRLQVVRDAILEVRKPTLFGELIIILVYLPILTLQGAEGKLFRPMAMTVVFVLLGSLLLSFTVIPAMIATFMTKPIKEREPIIVRWAQRLYRPMLDWVLRHRTAVLVVSGLMLIAGGWGFTRLGGEFIPRLSEGTITINVVRLAGVSIEQALANGESIEKALLAKFPDEIEHVWSRTGTAELATDPMGVELTDIYCSLKPRSQWKQARNQTELVELMNQELSDFPGMNAVFTQPIEMRINELVAGIRTDVGIKLFGDDLAVLERKAEEISRLAGQIPGGADISVEQLTGQPVFRVEIDRDKLSRFDFPAREALTCIQSIGGINVGEVYEGQRRFELQVRIDPTYASAPEDIERIPIRSATGAQLTLDRVTKPTLETGYATITREWSKRRIVIQCNVRGRDVLSFVNELKQRIAQEVSLDPGYYVRYGGQFENLERARARLAIVVPLSLLLIFALLYWTYGSIRDAILIFTGVPLAALGGVAALALRGLPFSLSAAVGFIALSGLAVLNGLVLVSHIKLLRSEGSSLDEAIRGSGMVRMRPVLMTALVAALGFIPMALSKGVGAEVQRPLATVVIGGIVTATALTILVLPVLYSVFGGRSKTEG